MRGTNFMNKRIIFKLKSNSSLNRPFGLKALIIMINIYHNLLTLTFFFGFQAKRRRMARKKRARARRPPRKPR